MTRFGRVRIFLTAPLNREWPEFIPALYPFSLSSTMLGSRLLRASGLDRKYTEAPPRQHGTAYPVLGLESIESTLFHGCYIYRSVQPFHYPHRIQLCNLHPKSRRVALNDRIWIQLACVTTQEYLDNSSSYTVEGWVIGVHFETCDLVEFTMVAYFQGVLQVVFVDVPQSHIDRTRCPPFTIMDSGVCYWMYMSVEEVEARARVIQAVDDDISNWSPTYRFVQEHLMRLRTSSVSLFELIDFRDFPPVRAFSRLPLSSLCSSHPR